MKWRDGLCQTYRISAGALTHALSGSFNVLSSLSCVFGSGACVASYIIDEVLNASFYGLSNTTGSVVLGVDVRELNVQLNDTIPFQNILQQQGQLTYNSRDYLEPNTVFYVGIMMSLSAALLKIISAQLAFWAQNNEMQSYVRTEYKNTFFKPSFRRDYVDVGMKAFLDSSTLFCVSCAIIGTILSYSPLHNAHYSFTYPESGPSVFNNNSDYLGPLAKASFPLSIFIQKNRSLDFLLESFNLSTSEMIGAHALANVSYGGGLFLTANNTKSFPLALPYVAGLLTFSLGDLLRRRLEHRQLERLQDCKERSLTSESLINVSYASV